MSSKSAEDNFCAYYETRIVLFFQFFFLMERRNTKLMPKDVLSSPSYIKKSWIAILSRFIFDPVKLETRCTVALVTIATISISLTITPIPSCLRPTQLCLLLLHPILFRVSLFTPSQEVAISFKFYL